MLVRSWNLFHGNALPPRRESYLEEMIRLASSDRPDVLLLQEIPAWALGRVAAWSGMTALADVAQPPRLGPVPIPSGLGRALTALRPDVFRSAFAGQGNATLLGPGLGVDAHEILVLNPLRVRLARGRELGLGALALLAWAKERRICQIVRLQRGLIVANVHATSFPGDMRIPNAELERAAVYIERTARNGDAIVIGGDFNVKPDAPILAWADNQPGPEIDHILVRGAEASPLRVWPEERRRVNGVLLSDHAPVEVDLTL